MSRQDEMAVSNSALWAAYGDALGFITELADARTLQFRVHTRHVTDTVPWKRTIGGKFGAIAELPAGCYSDDTQLRLSVCRAIRSDGYFDVEAFAKVELPVWLSYALGAGTSTKMAASSLSRQDVNWFSNFYSGKGRPPYIDAGGNGVAMRIQPHVWAAKPGAQLKMLLRDVVRNAVCTHGHPRAIAGACFHAICLRSALESGKIPAPQFWKEAVSVFSQIGAVIREDHDLHAFWLPVWEDRLGSSVERLFEEVANECSEDISKLERLFDTGTIPPYRELVEAIDASRHDMRGSATKTAILASALCWGYKDIGPQQALEEAVNCLDSDTDTVATMAGAVFGAVIGFAPSGALLDQRYIGAEARRLWNISQGNEVESFQYPDLMAWRPPKSSLDVVGLTDEGLFVEGLGEAEPTGPRLEARTKDGTCWQWLTLTYGQSIFAKQRITLKRTGTSSDIQAKSGAMTNRKFETPEVALPELIEQPKKSSRQPELFAAETQGFRVPQSLEPPALRTLDDLTSEAIKSGFNYHLLGTHLMELAERPNGIELAMGYAAVLAKARLARVLASSKRSTNAS